MRWVEPEPPEQAFRFWVAPATLVFHEVYDLRGRLEVEGDLEIADMHRHRDVAEAGRDRGPVSFDRPTTFGDSPEPRGP